MRYTSLEVEKIVTQDQRRKQGRYWIILPEEYLKKVAFLCAYFKCNNSLLLRASTCVMIDELLEEIVGDKEAVDKMLAKIQKPSDKNLEKRLLQKASIRSGTLTRKQQINNALATPDVVKPTGKSWGRSETKGKKIKKEK